MLDRFNDAIAAMLDEDPKAPATVIRERLRALGYAGGITILKEHLAKLRPTFLAARSYQRTTYLPGEVMQCDWWETGAQVAVGKGATREAMGLVTSLPHSAAHATVFTFSKTTADFCPALVGCLERLGGVPHGAVLDNDAAMVKPRRGGPARLVDDVAALFGALSLRPIVLRPRFPEGKGQDERMISYLQTSFLPLRRFESLEDLQSQHDDWARTVAYQRRPRRLAGTVEEAWRVERDYLGALPSPLPSTEQRVEVRVSKDGFVRHGGVDYSVPPGLSGRRVQLLASLRSVVVFLDGAELARHRRSYVPADVVLDPAHVRALRLAREAERRLRTKDVAVPAVNLARYDVALGVVP
jgi:transposase